MTSKVEFKSTWMGEDIISACFKRPKQAGEDYYYELQLGSGQIANIPAPSREGDELRRAIDRGELKCQPPVVPAVSSLPEDDAARNELPMFDGLLAYFPNALAYVSTISKIGNDQHNPGENMHWNRGKSKDHLNKIVRHTIDAGKKDARGVRHSGRLAWRALANLQEELEREEGAPLARGAKL